MDELDALLARVCGWLEGGPLPDAHALTEAIYAREFIGWTPPPELAADAYVTGDPELVGRFEDACAGKRYLEPGWQVRWCSEAGTWVSDGRITVCATAPDALVPASVSEGSAVALWLPCARNALSPGFFTVVARAGRLPADVDHARLYLNLSPEGALAVMRALLGEPALAGQVFEAKFANDPRAYGRRDTGHVYAALESAGELARQLVALSLRSPSLFRDETPPFTLRLARGVSIAEMPGALARDQSYGESRCRLFAEGVLEAVAAGEAPSAARPFIERAFGRAGTSAERPFESSWRLEQTQVGLAIRPR